MSEIALYRKYRPEKFKDVIGQDHVVEVLETVTKGKNPAHAYLFSGTRGTGKTTLARLLAKELGCTWKDLYEIDAASNRGIDEIRELREAVYALPFESPYKVYIIDEVHMLTTPAFNALLKTLEEPPSHAIFVLATTEKHKLPDTIISRCQDFAFKRPTEDDLVKAISKITKAEGYEIDKESLSLIAMLGEGSFRDSIGTLQKVISVSKDNKLTIDEVEKITGAPPAKLIQEVINGFLEEKIENVLDAVEQVVEQSFDIKIFVKLLLRDVRFAMLLLHAPEMKDGIKSEISDEAFGFLEEASNHERANKFPELLRSLLEAYEDMDRAYIKQLPLELAFVKVLGKNNKTS